MKRSTLIPFILLAIVIAGCTQSGLFAGQDKEVVRLALPFQPDVQFAPFYVSIEKGYFANENLDVRYEHLPENEALTLVGAGEIPFAVVSGEQVLLARAQGIPVVYVMAWWQDYPVAVAVPEESDIRAPQDLVGKKIGIPVLYGASYIGFRALIGAVGVAEGAVTLDLIGYNQVEAMLAGQEDAIVVYANNEPIQLEAQGMPMRVFKVADYVPLASNGLITSEKVLAENPELVRSMVAASLKGINDTIADPEGAFEICKKYVEGLEQANQEVLLKVLKASIPFWEDQQIGRSKEEAWENMHAILLEMGLLEKALEVEKAYTNDYLPEP
jgi:NitT/TauT family transport system substrate-binding protein